MAPKKTKMSTMIMMGYNTISKYNHQKVTPSCSEVTRWMATIIPM